MNGTLVGYGMTLLGVSAVAALLEWLAPTGGGMKKYLRLLTGLCLLCVLAAPIATGIRYLSEFSPDEWLAGLSREGGDAGARREEYRSEFEAHLTDTALANAGEVLAEEICAHFGIARGNCRVVLTVGDTGEDAVPTVTATVVLSGAAIWLDPDRIEAFVTGETGFSCRVAVEKKNGG